MKLIRIRNNNMTFGRVKAVFTVAIFSLNSDISSGRSCTNLLDIPAFD